jgi:transporter family protein
MSELTLGILGGLGSALTWALITTMGQSVAGRFTSAGINAFRALVGGLIVLVGAVGTGHGGEIVGMPLWVALTLWVSILIGYAGGDVIFFAGMQRLGVTRAHTLSMAHPLMSTLVGALFLGEPITALRGAGIGLVLGGISLIVTGRGAGGTDAPGSHWRGVQLILAAAVAWTIAAVMMKAPLQIVSPLVATAIRSPMAGLALWATPWARGTWKAVAESRGREAWLLAGICALSALSPVLFVMGLKYGGVAIGTVLATTSPLFTIPLEIVLLRQRPSRRTVVGALITVGGIVLMN